MMNEAKNGGRDMNVCVCEGERGERVKSQTPSCTYASYIKVGTVA